MNRIDRTVGVVLVNWNFAEHIIPCIESLLGGTVRPDRIVVVDNASQDGSPDMIVERFPEIELVRNKENLGFTGANNIGIARLISAGCDYIWILNNDTTVDKHCLATLRRHMELHAEVSACSGKILYSDTDQLIWYAGATYNRWTLQFKHRGQGEKDSGRYDNVEDVRFLSGCCMFVRRDAIERIGMFDDHFFLYAEDGDWCLRAAKERMLFHYVPQAVIRHKVSATVKRVKNRKTRGTSSPFSVYIVSRNRLYIIRKHAGNIFQTCSASIVSAAKFLSYAAALLLLFRLDKLRALVMAIYDGITRPLNASSSRILAPRYLP